MEEQAARKSTQAFLLRHPTLPIVFLLLAAAACELSDIDLNLADRFFDFSKGIWPAREAWWAEWLIHKRGKDLVTAIAAGSLLAWIVSFRCQALRGMRWQYLYLALAICLTAGAVSGVKKATGRHCPWDVQRYGGQAPYTRLCEPPPQACGPGVCFPAGHASGGFSLFAGYFAWRDRRRRAARCWLGAGILLGSVYGYAQMARGAHFFSHNIWSALICWLVSLALYLAMRRRLARQHPGRDSRCEIPPVPPVIHEAPGRFQGSWRSLPLSRGWIRSLLFWRGGIFRPWGSNSG